MTRDVIAAMFARRGQAFAEMDAAALARGKIVRKRRIYDFTRSS
jgi:hypothetical protein